MMEQDRLSHDLVSRVMLTKAEGEKRALGRIIKIIQRFSKDLAPYEDLRNEDPRYPKVDPDTAIQIVAVALLDGFSIGSKTLNPIALAAIYLGSLIQEDKPPRFSVGDISEYLGVSVSSTYNKVSELRGYIPPLERAIIDIMDLKTLVKRDSR